MESLNNQKNELNEKLNQLKLIHEVPRLHLSNYFSDLKTEVDVLFASKHLKEKDLNVKHELKQNWIEIVTYIESFENEFLKRQSTNKFNEAISKKTSSNIEYIESNLKHVQPEPLIQLIYDNITKLESLIFVNSTLMFLPRNKAFEVTFKKMNKKTTCGKLLHVKNGYFNKQSIGILQKNEKTLRTNGLTSEIIKLELLRHKWLSQINSTQIDIISLELEAIDLSVQNLIEINNDCFKQFYNLTIINLSNNNLTELDKDTFKSLNKLKVIDLSYNKLKQIHQDTFKSLTQLQKLLISFNDLKELHKLIFSDLVSLVELGLTRNQLKIFDKELFNGLSSLEKIYLAYNQLESIDGDTFKNLNKLARVDLSFNRLKLQRIHKDIFKNLTNLQWVNMSNNGYKLEKLAVEIPINLKFISFKNSLCGNNIDSLS